MRGRRGVEEGKGRGQGQQFVVPSVSHFVFLYVLKGKYGLIATISD